VCVRVHETQHTGQTMNQVVTALQEWFGKPSACKVTREGCGEFSDTLYISEPYCLSRPVTDLTEIRQEVVSNPHRCRHQTRKLPCEWIPLTSFPSYIIYIPLYSFPMAVPYRRTQKVKSPTTTTESAANILNFMYIFNSLSRTYLT
jgi:hypothetical protein